jgi:hypothetical protein
MSLLTGLPENTGGCQSALVDKLGVSLSHYHHAMFHIANHSEMTNRPVETAVLRRQSRPIIAKLPIYESAGFLDAATIYTHKTSIRVFPYPNT